MTTGTELATRTNGTVAGAATGIDWDNREYLNTLKNSVGRNLSDAEFALAVQASKATGLRLDTRELWAYKRGRDEPMTLAISIDGFRAIAHTSGVYAGEEGPLYCSKDGVWSEVWTGEGLPHAAKFTVYRRDIERPFTAVVLFSEFRALGGAVWGKAPIHMAGVRAATHAFRKAFRQEIAHQEYAAQATGAVLGAAEGDPNVIDVEPATAEVIEAAPRITVQAADAAAPAPEPTGEITREDALAEWQALHDEAMALRIEHPVPKRAATASELLDAAESLRQAIDARQRTSGGRLV